MSKLTLVSVYYSGRQLSGFYLLPFSSDGVVRVSRKVLSQILEELNVPEGATYTIG